MSEKTDEAMELASAFAGVCYFAGKELSLPAEVADLLRPILAERDALRVERDRMRELVVKGEEIQRSNYGNATDTHIYMIGWGKMARDALAASPSPDVEFSDEEIAEMEGLSRELGAGLYVPGVSKPISANAARSDPEGK